jgi:hypothetical protein
VRHGVEAGGHEVQHELGQLPGQRQQELLGVDLCGGLLLDEAGGAVHLVDESGQFCDSGAGAGLGSAMPRDSVTLLVVATAASHLLESWRGGLRAA